MKVQQVSYLSLPFYAAAFLDFSYDFCDSNSVLSSLNPLCERTGISSSLTELPVLHGSPQKPQQVLSSSQLEHSHDHEHTHNHESHAWSLPPQCIQKANATDKYCVYTDTSFASHRGISIYTNSIYSASLRNLEAFTSPIQEGTNLPTDPRYAPQAIPGKGLGLVALRPIHRGEELFRSTAVLLLQEDEFNDTEKLPYYQLAAKQLPKQSKKMLDELKGHFGGDPIEDKINTNCFAVELDVEGLAVTATAVFPEMSRMNHDCRPNAHYYFDPQTFVQHVHTLRTILPGEEITISYIDPLQHSKHRKEALHTAWGFPCGCNACNAPLPIRSASDARIAEIQRLQELLGDYTAVAEVKSSKDGMAMADLLVQLYELEGMLGPIAEGYAYAAIEYSSAMRKWEALRYAHMALEAGLLYGGPKDGDVLAMAELIASPESHWSWGVRSRRRWEGKQEK